MFEPNFHRVSIALIFGLLLSGCGFQLLEPSVAPVSMHVSVRDNGAPLLAATLRSRLELRGLADPSTELTRTISVRAELRDRRLLAIDSAGRAAEYREEHEVQARAHWSTERPGEWREYRTTRDYSYNESQVLGKSQERQLILSEMRVELADRIIENLIYDAVQNATGPATSE